MFRKGPRVSRRLCGFRRGRPFSGSVVNPSFFFFFQPTPPPQKPKQHFFCFPRPSSLRSKLLDRPSIERKTVKSIPSKRGILAAQRGSGSSREDQRGKDPQTSGPHRSSGRPSRVFFFFFWVAETLRRGRLEQREVCRFFTTGWRGRESEGDRRGVSRSGADGLEP